MAVSSIFDVASFSLSEILSLGESEPDAIIAANTPKRTTQVPDPFTLAPGSGADKCSKVAYNIFEATTVNTAHEIGSGGAGIASRNGPLVVKFTKIRFWKIINLDTSNDLIVWGATGAPAALANAETIPPSTSTNQGSREARAPGANGFVIGATDKLNVVSSAGIVKYLVVLAGE